MGAKVHQLFQSHSNPIRYDNGKNRGLSHRSSNQHQDRGCEDVFEVLEKTYQVVCFLFLKILLFEGITGAILPCETKTLTMEDKFLKDFVPVHPSTSSGGRESQ